MIDLSCCLRALGGLLLAAAVACDSSPTSPSPPPVSAPVVLVGAGDIAECGVPGAEATAKLLDGIAGTVITLGDNAYYSGTSAEFRDCYAPTWGRHKNRTRPIPGNHDYLTPGAAGYFGYFGSVAAPPDGYYSVQAGAWLLMSLNSEVPMAPGSPQHEWLRRELASRPSACLGAFVHRPLFSSSQNGPSPDTRPLWQLLYEAGAEFVASGHEHVYERFAPQDPSGRADQRGIRLFVAGTGGAPLYSFYGVSANSEVQIRSWGVLRLTLVDGSYTWDFLPAGDTAPRDSGTQFCH